MSIMKPPEKNTFILLVVVKQSNVNMKNYYIALVLMSILINHSNYQCRVIYLEYESQIIFQKNKFIISIS